MGNPFSKLSVPKDTILLYDQGNFYSDHSSYEMAQYYYGQALDKFRGLDVNNSIDRLKWLCRIYQQLAFTHNKLDQSIKANFYSSQALDIANRLNNSVLMIKCLDIRGTIRYSTGGYVEALNSFNNALKLKLKKISRQCSDVANSHYLIGKAHLRQYHYHDALVHFQSALKMYRKLYSDQHIIVAQVMNKIGIAYSGQSKYIDALTMHQKALEVQLKLKDRDHSKIRKSYKYIVIVKKHLALENHVSAADIHSNQIEYHDTLETSKRVLGDEEEILEGKCTDIKSLHSKAADIYQHICKYTDAIEKYEVALAMRIALHKSNRIERPNSYFNLRLIYQSQSKCDKALSNQGNIVPNGLIVYGENGGRVPDTFQNLKILYILLLKLDEAVLMHRTCGENQVAIADPYLNLGDVYYFQSEYQRATYYYNITIRVYIRHNMGT